MDMVVRVALVYAGLLLAFRFIGKRELSKLSPFELVTLLLVPEIVGPALTTNDHSLTGALLGVATLLCLAVGNSLLDYRSRLARRVTESEPTLLVHRGALVERNLHRERVRPDEIASEMRLSGIERLEQVRWAVLEPGGRISFVRTDGADTDDGGDADVPE